jgi:hypothetical protein
MVLPFIITQLPRALGANPLPLAMVITTGKNAQYNKNLAIEGNSIHVLIVGFYG